MEQGDYAAFNHGDRLKVKKEENIPSLKGNRTFPSLSQELLYKIDLQATPLR